MILSGIYNSTTNFIQKFTGRLGNNQLANLAAINNLANEINANLPYLSRVYSVTQNGPGALPTIEVPLVNTITSSGPKSQGCKCTCWYKADHPLAPFNGLCRTFCCMTISASIGGVTTWTIPGAQDEKVGLFFSALPTPGGNITVDRLPDTADAAVFSVTTTDLTGIASDVLLNNTIVNIINFREIAV